MPATAEEIVINPRALQALLAASAVTLYAIAAWMAFGPEGSTSQSQTSDQASLARQLANREPTVPVFSANNPATRTPAGKDQDGAAVIPDETPEPTPIPPTPVPPPPYVPPVSRAAAADGTTNGCPEIIAAALGRAGCMISYCESGWNWNATGGEGERGAFQIHPIHRDSTYDPAGNVAAAVRISGNGEGWGPWTVRSVLDTGVCPNGKGRYPY